MNRRRLYVIVAAGLALGMVLLFFPLFRVAPLGSGDRRIAVPDDGPISAANFAEGFWMKVLPDSYEQAIPVSELFQSLDEDSGHARQLHGRQVGIGGTTYFYLRGRGEVLSMESNRAVIAIEGFDRRACIELGPIFGNAVRDGTGLIDVDMFPSSQEFNALSTELNQRVEKQVLEPLHEKIAVGGTVEFVGCAQSKSDRDLDPLCLVPVHLSPLESEVGP